MICLAKESDIVRCKTCGVLLCCGVCNVMIHEAEGYCEECSSVQIDLEAAKDEREHGR